MGKTVMNQAATTHVEQMLRAELARGDRALGGVAPVLSHLLASSGHALVNEDVVARLRGMITDAARQLLTAAKLDGVPDQLHVDALSDHLAANGPILSHFYSLAMEGQLARRLEQRSSLDPVLSPLLQELIASDQAEVAELGMNALAAQSRFIQAQRRMTMPLGDLPARLYHGVLECWQAWPMAGDCLAGSELQAVLQKLRITYDEGSTRLALLARLSRAMRQGAVVGLDLNHAGLALFATSLATITGQPRDLAIIACHERQAARLAIGLRAAGLDAAAIERQFLLLEPAERLPRHMGEIAPDAAADLLRQSSAWTAG